MWYIICRCKIDDWSCVGICLKFQFPQLHPNPEITTCIASCANTCSVRPEILEFIRCAALDGLWIWDLREPTNEWMDDRFWKTLGYELATMPHLSSAWQGLIHPDDLQCALTNFARHVADPNHPYDQIVRYRHANGSTVWVRCRGLVLRDADNTPHRMLGARVDVTELELAKQELQKKRMPNSPGCFGRQRKTARYGISNSTIRRRVSMVSNARLAATWD